MEWNRRAEQGERGRRRACVLTILPCSRLQHKVLQYHAGIKTITLHVLIILKFASTRSGAKNRNPRQLRRLLVSLTAPQVLSQSGCTAGQQLTSLAPQDLKKSSSSAGFVEIVKKRRSHPKISLALQDLINLRAPQVLLESLRAPEA